MGLNHFKYDCARESELKIVAEQARDATVLALAGTDAVRADQHIRHRPPQAVRWQRLVLEHIQSSTAEMSGLERVDHGHLVHDRSPTDVAKYRIGLRQLRGKI